MNKQELQRAINEIKSNCKEACRKLRIEYALSRNPIKIGDIISHKSFPSKTIKVSQIDVPDFGDYSMPECKYIGNVINEQNGTVYEDITYEMYQSAVDEINGESYVMPAFI